MVLERVDKLCESTDTGMKELNGNIKSLVTTIANK